MCNQCRHKDSLATRSRYSYWLLVAGGLSALGAVAAWSRQDMNGFLRYYGMATFGFGGWIGIAILDWACQSLKTLVVAQRLSNGADSTGAPFRLIRIGNTVLTFAWVCLLVLAGVSYHLGMTLEGAVLSLMMGNVLILAVVSSSSKAIVQDIRQAIRESSDGQLDD